jgi:carboxylate-amine ligase
MNEIVFNPSPKPTIGVELELQILSRPFLCLTSLGAEILDEVPLSFQTKIKPEFIQSMVEINTDICADLPQVEQDLSATYRYLETLAEKKDALIYASSLHPFSCGKDQQVSKNPRYERIMEELQMVGTRFITQGFHVHIGMPNAEAAIEVTNAMRIYLPMLLSLTTSSPFYEGVDTGLYSYRTKLFEALPLAGMPDSLTGWNGYVQLVETMRQCEIIQSFRDLWWDVRPHPDFGTVEVRVCDIPSFFPDILAMVALIQALAVLLSEEQKCLLPNIQVLRANKWQAARRGLEGAFVDPIQNKRIYMLDAILALYETLKPIAKNLGSLAYFEDIETILQRKTSAHLQRQLHREGRTLQEVIQTVYQKFWK